MARLSSPPRLLTTLAAAGLAFLVLLAYLSSGSSSRLAGGSSSLRRLLAQEARDGLTASEGGHLWDRVFVVNLPHRTDRRAHMEKLSAALGLPFTFVDAISTSHSVVPWILERLLDEQDAAETAPGGLEAHDFDDVWAGHGESWRAHALHVLEDETTTYELRSNATDLKRLVYPPEYRRTAGIDPAGPTACWLSHLKTMKTAIDSGAQSVLILEDDVDAEFDLAAKWQEMSRALATRDDGWDMVFLGFIWANERHFRPTVHPGLRRAVEPAGNHAYALSHRGVRRLYQLLVSEPTLFERPIDHDIPKNVLGTLRAAEEHGERRPWEFEAFTTVPPLVIPGGDLIGLGTDIGGIGGTLWGGLLADSAVQRIAAHEGHPFARLTDKDVQSMLAVENM